jgi:hypothetical protein
MTVGAHTSGAIGTILDLVNSTLNDRTEFKEILIYIFFSEMSFLIKQ